MSVILESIMSPIAPAGRSDLPLLDALDHRILAELQADASLNNVALARRVHASAPTCLRRETTARYSSRRWVSSSK